MTTAKMNLEMAITRGLVVSTLMASVALTGNAFAQASMPGKPVVEEIVVTSRKREERLQEIPLTVAAFNAGALARQGITGLKDIAQQTPGFVFQEFASSFNPAPTLRGLTQFNVSSSVANVSSFVDGIYIPRNYSVDIGLADLNRVEVVKGPQSALYGQNAFAGAINYVMERPTNDLHALATVTGGNAGRLDYKVALSGPLIKDKLAVRGFYSRSEFDGTWKNNYPVTTGKAMTVGGHKNESYGGSVRITPTSWLTADVDFFKTDRHEDLKPAYNVSSGDSQNLFNCGTKLTPAAFGPPLICGTLSIDPATYQSKTSPRLAGILQPQQPGFNNRTEFTRVALRADLTNELRADYLFGRVRAVATEITASANNPVTPVIGLNLPALLAGQFVFGPYFSAQKEGGLNTLTSHDGRLSWDHGPFKAMVGYYYAENTDIYAFRITSVLGGQQVTGNASSAFDFTGYPFALLGSTTTVKSNAEYGRLSYSFLDDKATLAAEVRHNVEDKSNQDAVSAEPLNRQLQSKSFDTTTPRITLDYKVTDRNLVYASAAQGSKSGGFNGFVVGSAVSRTVLVPAEQAFAPEENWTYEVGTKNSFMDGRLIVNADFFYVKWSNLQIQGLPSNAPVPSTNVPVITLNLGNATSYGFESDGTFAITEKLKANYAFSIIEPTYDAGTTSPRFRNVCDNIVCPKNSDVSGKTLPRTSKQQFAAGLTWSDYIASNYNYTLHADVTYQSKQQAEEMNLAQIPARTLVNLSAGVQKDWWELTVWGKNVLNKKYVADSFFIVSGVGYSPSFGEKATYGITATARY